MLDWKALVAGGMAGVSVDIALFPLDTVKTRMQSSVGFFKSGGFKGVYNGLGSAAAGSFPNAAIFFCTYESSKQLLVENGASASVSATLAGALGEISACLVRVPVENVKQKVQAGVHGSSSWHTAKEVLRSEGFQGFYRGYFITVFREIPFSMIQFPIWEGFKDIIRERYGEVTSWQSAICGSVAGAFSAAVTTPLDVIKTRLMLKKDSVGVEYRGVVDIIKRVATEEGMSTFAAGIAPRTMWIGIGGFVFFGAYEKSKTLLDKI